MNIKRAMLITKDRLDNMRRFVPSNLSEEHIAKETIEYLEFVEKLLDKEIKEDEQSRTLDH